MYYKAETHDNEHVNDDDDFIIPRNKVELIPDDTPVIKTEHVHGEADDPPAPVVVPEVDPQQNDVHLMGGMGMELDTLNVNIKHLHIYLIMIYLVVK